MGQPTRTLMVPPRTSAPAASRPQFVTLAFGIAGVIAVGEDAPGFWVEFNCPGYELRPVSASATLHGAPSGSVGDAQFDVLYSLDPPETLAGVRAWSTLFGSLGGPIVPADQNACTDLVTDFAPLSIAHRALFRCDVVSVGSDDPGTNAYVDVCFELRTAAA